jgi:hypothetical protein
MFKMFVELAVKPSAVSLNADVPPPRRPPCPIPLSPGVDVEPMPKTSCPYTPKSLAALPAARLY